MRLTGVEGRELLGRREPLELRDLVLKLGEAEACIRLTFWDVLLCDGDSGTRVLVMRDPLGLRHKRGDELETGDKARGSSNQAA